MVGMKMSVSFSFRALIFFCCLTITMWVAVGANLAYLVVRIAINNIMLYYKGGQF